MSRLRRPVGCGEVVLLMGGLALPIWIMTLGDELDRVRRSLTLITLLKDAPETTVGGADGPAWMEVRLEGTDGPVSREQTEGLVVRQRVRCRDSGTRGGGWTTKNEETRALAFRVVDDTGSAIINPGGLRLLHDTVPMPNARHTYGRDCIYEESVLHSGDTTMVFGCLRDGPDGRIVTSCGEHPVLVAPRRQAVHAALVGPAEASLVILCLPVPLLLVVATLLSRSGLGLRRSRS